MKLAIFAAALMISGAAYAQSTDTPAQAPAGAMAGGTTVAASNAAPKRDARGVPVISSDATAPAGWNEGPHPAGTGVSASASATPMGTATDLPPCTRKVTDHCMQTYERGHPHG
jgi:hypothetical protein